MAWNDGADVLGSFPRAREKRPAPTDPGEVVEVTHLRSPGWPWQQPIPREVWTDAAEIDYAIGWVRAKLAERAPASLTGTAWANRILARLEAELVRLTADETESIRPTTEVLAAGMIKGLAVELQAAAVILGKTADTLKYIGKGPESVAAWKAAQRAASVAGEYLSHG